MSDATLNRLKNLEMNNEQALGVLEGGDIPKDFQALIEKMRFDDKSVSYKDLVENIKRVTGAIYVCITTSKPEHTDIPWVISVYKNALIAMKLKTHRLENGDLKVDFKREDFIIVSLYRVKVEDSVHTVTYGPTTVKKTGSAVVGTAVGAAIGGGAGAVIGYMHSQQPREKVIRSGGSFDMENISFKFYENINDDKEDWFLRMDVYGGIKNDGSLFNVAGEFEELVAAVECAVDFDKRKKAKEYFSKSCKNLESINWYCGSKALMEKIKNVISNSDTKIDRRIKEYVENSCIAYKKSDEARKRISQLERELNSLGLFTYTKKKRIKNEINELKNDLVYDGVYDICDVIN